jgi:NAD(P)-dependent dehydrogenase (short-subunit alcohol dehydrogenase family)
MVFPEVQVEDEVTMPGRMGEQLPDRRLPLGLAQLRLVTDPPVEYPQLLPLRDDGFDCVVETEPALLDQLKPGLRHLLPFYPPSSYPAAKAAVEAFTRYLAQEGGPIGIRANYIRPGQIETPATMTPEGEHFVHK